MKAQICYKETDGDECAHCWKLRRAAPQLAEALNALVNAVWNISEHCPSLTRERALPLAKAIDQAQKSLLAAGYTEEA